MNRKLLVLFLTTVVIYTYTQLPPATHYAIQEYGKNLPRLLRDLQANKLTPDFQNLMSKILIYNNLDHFSLPSEMLNWHSVIRSLSFSPDGKYLAIIPHTDADGHTDSKTVYIINAYSSTNYKVLRHNHAIAAVLLSPNNNYILTYGYEDGVSLWDLNNLESTPLNLYKGNDVTALAFSANGNSLLLGCSKIAYLWKLEHPQFSFITLNHKGLLRESTNEPLHIITSVACSPDGKHLLIGSSKGLVYLWDTTYLQEWPKLLGSTSTYAQSQANTLDYDCEVTSIAFSPDGHYAVTGSADNKAYLWDITKPAAAPKLLEHNSSVNAVAISPCGNYIVTGSNDKKARLWNLHHCTLAPLVLERSEPVTSVAFISPDSGYVITSCNSHGYESTYLSHLGDLNNYTLEDIIEILQQRTSSANTAEQVL